MSETASEYRARHVAFVTGLSGTTVTEVLLCMVVLPLSSALQFAITELDWFQYLVPTNQVVIRTLLEFFLRTIPITAAATVAADYLTAEAIILITGIAFFYGLNVLLRKFGLSPPPPLVEPPPPSSQLVGPSSQHQLEEKQENNIDTPESPTVINTDSTAHQQQKTTKLKTDGKDDPMEVIEHRLSGEKKLFLSEFRSTMMLSTCVAILAVDFTMFPRRFAKTETYGTGVMDYGVGFFVFSNALTSRAARGIFSREQNIGKLLWRVVSASLPMFVLGTGRMLLTLNQPHHVSEYGVHWNFFFSLGTIATIVGILDIFQSRILNCKPTGLDWYNLIQGFVVICFYQMLISVFGFRDYLFNYPRNGFIHANKEGIYSSLGYISIYCFGMFFARLIWKAKTARDWKATIVVMWLTDVMLWVITGFCIDYIEPVSRRMANISYVFWVVAQSLFLLNLFLSLDLLVGDLKPANRPPLQLYSVIREAISKNQLFFFLLANVLTGFVNAIMHTIDCPVGFSFFVVTVYMLFLCFVGVMFRKVELKFW